MKTYGQYRPAAKAAEILGDRWTLLIVRDLLFGPVGFNEIARGMSGISRSILSTRLRHLERLGLIELAGGGAGYELTGPGRHLTWAARWILQDPAQAELDPDLLIMWISRHVATDALAPGKPWSKVALVSGKSARQGFRTPLPHRALTTWVLVGGRHCATVSGGLWFVQP
jgi:DNA-binding HxlR family transcriptional regulator